MRNILIVITFFLAPAAYAACEANLSVEPPKGEFVVIDLRSANDVASPPPSNLHNRLLGQIASFGDRKLWLNTEPFDTTRVVLPYVAIVDPQDPNLSDVMILPRADSQMANCWRLDATQLIRSGKSIDIFLMVDRRVLVYPVANGALYAILEKPLRVDEARKFQEFLSEAGYYQGEITGTIDESTRAAIAAYSEDRGAAYRFANPAITENLLAELD